MMLRKIMESSLLLDQLKEKLNLKLIMLDEISPVFNALINLK
jgi:hypothetical protein